MHISRRKPSFLHSLGRRLLLGLVCFCLLAGGVLAAGLVWLGSGSADRFVLETILPMANEALQTQGLRIELDEFSGPLPSQAHAHGLRLHDTEGLFLEAEKASLRLSLASLLSRGRTLEVQEILLHKPVMHRLPLLRPEEAPTPEPEGPAILHLDLPFAIAIHSMRMDGGAVALSAPQTAGESAPFLPLAFKGEATLEKGMLAASAHLLFGPVGPDQPFASPFARGISGGSLSLESLRADFSGADSAANTVAMEANLVLSGEEERSFSLHLQARHGQESSQVSVARLQGLGLLAEASGQWHWSGARGEGHFTLSGEEAGAWQDMAVQVAGVDRAMLEAVAFPLALEAQVSATATEASATLERMQAGVIEGSGAVRLLLGDTPAGDGEFRLEVRDLAPLTPAANRISGPLSLSLRLGSGEVVPGHEAMGAGSRVHMSLESPRLEMAAGVLEALQATVDTDFATDSTGFAASGALRARARENAVGQASVQGDWQVFWPLPDTGEAGPPVPEPLQVEAGLVEAGLAESGLQQPQQTARPGRARLSGLDIDIFGLRVTGDFGVTLDVALLQNQEQKRPETQPTGTGDSLSLPYGLSLEGELAAQVRDWQPLAALAGRRITGTGASFAARFQPPAQGNSGRNQSGQGMTLDARMDSFSSPEDNLSLAALSAQAEVVLPTSATLPVLRLNIRTGMGHAGPLAWREASATADGNGQQGSFSATVQQPARENRNTTAGQNQNRVQGREGRPSRKTFGNPGEMLVLSGSYDWLARTVSLQNAMVQMPPNALGGLGLRLRQPAQVLLVDGFSLQNLVLDCLYGGSVQASVQKGAAGLEASATIEAMPTELLRRLGGSGVPEGRFDAALSAKIGPEGTPPAARLVAELRLAERGSVAESGGVVRMLVLPDGSIRSRNIPANAEDTASGQETGPQVSQIDLGVKPDIRFEAAIMNSGGRPVLSGGMDVLPAPAVDGPGEAGSGPGQAAAPLADGPPITFQIPLRSTGGGLPMPDFTAASRVAVRWKGRLEQLWHFVPMPDTRASGLLFLDLAMNGPLDAMQVGGSAYLAGGRYQDKVQSVLLTDITVQVQAASRYEYNIVASASDGAQGTIGLEGTLSKAEAPVFALRGQARNLAPLHRDDLFLLFSGIFSAQGPVVAPEVRATVLVERGELTLASAQGSTGVQTLKISNRKEEAVFDTGQVPTCDITVNVPGRFFVRGFGMDSEWQGTLHVVGPIAEPELTGSLTPIRGSFELLSKPFTFAGGGIEFMGGTELNPGLNLELVYAGSGDIEAVIMAGGTLKKPELELQSRPSLPQDEILARVLFGKNVSELSRFEALQLANSMRQLSGLGGGGFSLFSSIRTAVGLDVLRVGGGSSGATQRQSSGLAGEGTLARQDTSAAGGSGEPSLEAGKYLNDNIYIGVEQGATPESTGVRVEVELFPSITVQGRTSSVSNQAGIGWKMDY